ncbi:MAG TPA: hypothetical protein VFA11_08760 [Acidimicrobiales bacterium]|nr:hypothetical protein [Acidimicrobiales bacterium]
MAVVAALGSCAVWLVPAASSQAQTTPTTYTVGVDWSSPAGHNFEYTDFFPRSGINVHNGDVVDFKVPSTASSDGLHIVGILKQGESVNQAFADPANALVSPDSDESGANPLQNLGIFGPSSPPPGSGVPGACGDATTPCPYDGSAQVSSGQVGPGSDFFVKLALPSGFTGSVNAVDFGHPIVNPSATINVVADSAAASAQSDLNTAAQSQAQSDTSDALAAESAANVDQVTTNADGTHTHTVNAGVATQYVELMEFLPGTLKIAHGDHVTWNYGSKSEPHTVEFPPQATHVYSPFDFNGLCEGASGDTPSQGGLQAGPPNFGCASGANFEASFLPAPRGTATIQSPAYRMVASDGGIFDFGQSKFYGSAGNIRLNSPIVATATTGDQGGYYEVAADGGIFTYGDAGFFGSEGGKKIAAPIVSMLADPFGQGYILFGADGSTYSFGPGAPPVASGQVPGHLAAPIVGAAPANNPGGPPGFWLVAKDGGIFTLNGAPYLGSMGGKKLNAPIVGITGTADGGGYYEVASDGGIFTFGDAVFHGSTGNLHLAAPIVGMVSTPTGQGYWLVGKDGGVFSFGDATFHGSTGAMKLNAPVVGIDGTYSLGSSGILINIPAGNPNALPTRTSYTFTFADAGAYPFQCGFHQMMTGVVLVS